MITDSACWTVVACTALLCGTFLLDAYLFEQPRRMAALGFCWTEVRPAGIEANSWHNAVWEYRPCVPEEKQP